MRARAPEAGALSVYDRQARDMGDGFGYAAGDDRLFGAGTSGLPAGTGDGLHCVMSA